MNKRGRDGLKQLMGSLGNSWSCNDLPKNGHLGLHALQTDEQTEIDIKNRKEIAENGNREGRRGIYLTSGNNEGACNKGVHFIPLSFHIDLIGCVA